MTCPSKQSFFGNSHPPRGGSCPSKQSLFGNSHPPRGGSCPSKQSLFGNSHPPRGGSCPYANLLGIPGQGVHAARIAPFGGKGLALNDILLTLAAALITTVATGYSFWLVAAAWFIAGELFHIAFGTQTAFLTLIGLKVCESRR